MSSKGSVLIFGLNGVNKAAAGISAETILAGVQKSRDDAISAGWDADYFLFDHEDTELLDKVSAKLKEKQWDVVCIGGGVRLQPVMTPLFEDVTNTVVTVMSPPPRFVFQTTPDGLVERLEYQFPDRS